MKPTDNTAPTESIESTEPSAPIERTEPTEPIESTEPSAPIDNSEPLLPMHSIDPSDHNDHRDSERGLEVMRALSRDRSFTRPGQASEAAVFRTAPPPARVGPRVAPPSGRGFGCRRPAHSCPHRERDRAAASIGQRWPDSRRHDVRWHHARRLTPRPSGTSAASRNRSLHRSDYVSRSMTSNASTA